MPSDAPHPSAWPSVELELAVRLPDDYKEYIEIYGSGGIDGFLWIFNPFSGNENLNLKRQVVRQRQVLADLRSQGEALPYDAFPLQGGILPFGVTDNGDVLFWKTERRADDWTVVVNESRSPAWERFDLSMCGFLQGVLAGQVRCNIFPRTFPGPSPLFKVAP